MHVFIANASPRHYHLHYRLPEHARMFDRVIPMGTQAKIDVKSPEERDELVEQLNRYGAQSLETLGRNPDYSGLIFSTRDKPINVDAIRQGFDLTDELAVERALEARKVGAIAADIRQSELAQQAGVTMEGSSITVQEEAQGPHDIGDKMVQTVEVVREGREGLSKRGRAKG